MIVSQWSALTHPILSMAMGVTVTAATWATPSSLCSPSVTPALRHWAPSGRPGWAGGLAGMVFSRDMLMVAPRPVIGLDEVGRTEAVSEPAGPSPAPRHESRPGDTARHGTARQGRATPGNWTHRPPGDRRPTRQRLD